MQILFIIILFSDLYGIFLIFQETMNNIVAANWEYMYLVKMLPMKTTAKVLIIEAHLA